MKYSTISAILRGRWLIDKTFADSNLPIFLKMVSGESGQQFTHIKDDMMNHESPEVQINRTPVLVANTSNVYKVRPYSNLDQLPYGSIAVVEVTGPVLKFGDYCSYGSIDTAQLLGRLAVNNNVIGALLDVDSPGGQVSGTSMLADAVKDFGKKKPIVGYINDGMAASAAMWIISACTEVYCSHRTDEVGSIGVYCTIADYKSFYKDYYKLRVEDVYAPESEDKNKDYEDAINGDTSKMEEDLSIIAQEFINTIQTNRAGKIKGSEWSTGKMFYAPEAIKMGLIDGIKTLSQVTARIEKLSKDKQASKQSQNMAFEKTLAAAKSEEFAVVDGGFLLTEEQLNNIEASINETDLATTNEALDQANASIQDLTAERDAANQNADSLQEQLNAANATIAERDATIADLNNTIATLSKKPSSTGSTAITKADDKTEEKEEKITLNHPDHPINKDAARRVAAKANQG